MGGHKKGRLVPSSGTNRFGLSRALPTLIRHVFERKWLSTLINIPLFSMSDQEGLFLSRPELLKIRAGKI